MSDTDPNRTAERRTLMSLIYGTLHTNILRFAAELRLADAIGDDGADLDALVRHCDIPADRLIRLLRGCATLGLCVEDGPGHFRNTATGTLLRSDSEDRMLELVLLMAHPDMQQAWFGVAGNMRTGRTAFDEAFGRPVFGHVADDPELVELFSVGMHQLTRAARVESVLPQRYDFGRFTTVADVGGGDGTLLSAILHHHSEVNGIVFDSPTGITDTARTLEAAGLGERCTIESGSFFERVPHGAEVYVLKSVMHNWEDDDAAVILRRCREQLPPHGRVLIIEPVLPSTANPATRESGTVALDAPVDPYLNDLNMMTLLGGKERTRAEFETLCARAGLHLVDVIALPGSDFAVVETEALR